MEILKGFVFDIQRFADNTVDVTSATVDGPSTTDSAYYYDLGTSASVTTGSTIASLSSYVTAVSGLTDLHSYLRVVVDSVGNYTFDIVGYTTAGGVVTDGTNMVNIATLNFTSGVKDGVIVSSAASTAGKVSFDSVVATTSSGGSISVDAVTNPTAAVKYQAADNSQATITYGATAAASVLTTGSVKLSNSYTDKSIMVGTEVVTVATAGSFVLSSSGAISSIEKGTSIYAGNDATPTNGQKYTVSADGLHITVATAGTGDSANNGEWYLTSALTNTTITLDGSVNGFDTISNAGRAADTLVTANGASLYGFVDNTTTMYVYRKNSTTFLSGYVDSALGDQIGVITPDGNGTYTYDASVSATSQVIANTNAASTIVKVVGSGKDDRIDFAATVPNHAVTLDGGAGDDTMTLGAVYDGASVVGGAGKDNIAVTDSLAGAVAGVFIGGDDGVDTITVTKSGAGNATEWTVSGGAGNDIFDLSAIGTGTATNWSVIGGEGDDSVNASGANLTYSTIDAGAGNDTIIAVDGTNTIYGGAGADVFDLSAGNNLNIGDYAYGEDVFYTNNASETAVSNAIAAGTFGTDGKLTVGGKIATVTSSAGFYAATLMDNTAAKSKVDVAWVKEDATTIDASTVARKVILRGDGNSEGDLLIGGAKADTIYAGKGDSVYGGAGNDTLVVGGNTGVYVGVAAASGADTVTGFAAGFDIETADAIYLVDGSIEDATITNTNATDIQIKSGKGTLKLSTGLTGYDAAGTKLLIGDKKVYSIAKNQAVAISDADEIANYFYGTESSGINLANYQEDITVDLSSSMFKNINFVTGGKSNTTLMGSAKADTLYGGAGSSSLFGGAGKDSMVSGAGKTEFFITTGAGKDSVQGFVTGTTEDTSDVVNIFNAGISGISRSANDIFTIKVSDADSIQVKQATAGVDQKIQWASGEAKGVAKIGFSSTANTFSYDSEVTNYLGGSKNDTVTFSGSDDLNLWLDNESAYASIETFDASNSTGSVLIAGSGAASETIKGGRGDSSLWGGAGNQKDVLIGNTSATNTFFYGMGQGSDSISGSAKDTVNLLDIQLSDLTGADIDTSNRRVILSTTAGDKVTVSGGIQDFVIGGVTYTTKYGSKTDWSVKE